VFSDGRRIEEATTGFIVVAVKPKPGLFVTQRLWHTYWKPNQSLVKHDGCLSSPYVPLLVSGLLCRDKEPFRLGV